MPIYEINDGGLRPVAATSFGAEGIYERRDIQALLGDSIEVLGDRLMVLAEEFGDWVDSSRRIDLLCLDANANLVVVELKRTEDGGHMELQAVRYAAMVSAMTFDQAVEAFARHSNRVQPDIDAAKASIMEFLGWDEVQEDQFAQDARIILASADFGKELTTAVMWLIERGIDIRCVRLKPYRMDGGAVLVDIQQLIPLPEAASFQTQIGVKKQAERKERTKRDDLLLQFWSGLLERARTKTQIHGGRSPTKDHWLSGSAGRTGFNFTYTVRRHDSNVELWIGLGRGMKAQNKMAFAALSKQRDAIDAGFGDKLDWEELPERDGSRVRFDVQGGYLSSPEDWPRIQDDLIDAMVRLERAMQQRVRDLQF